MKLTERELRRFWTKVDVREQNQCWPWTASVSLSGYGFFRLGGKTRGAHRVSLQMRLGRELVEGECACHTCDNPACVNPAHLFVGSQLTNMRDAYRKGRHTAVLSLPKKTHCPKGHSYSGENLYVNPSGHFICRLCAEMHRAEYRRRHQS